MDLDLTPESVLPLSDPEAEAFRWATSRGSSATVESVLDYLVCALTTALAVEDVDRLAAWLSVVRRMITSLPS